MTTILNHQTSYNSMTSRQLRDLIAKRGGGTGGARTKKQLVQLLEYEDNLRILRQQLENGPVVRISLIDGDRSAEALRQVQRDLGFSMQTSFTERCFYVIDPTEEQVRRLLTIQGAVWRVGPSIVVGPSVDSITSQQKSE